MRGIAGIGVVVVVVASGCGDNRTAGGGAVSGSRLRAHSMAHGNARVFQGFFDTERDEDCTFQLPGGATTARCLPRSSSSSSYADPDCTTPTMPVYVDACEAPPRYITATGDEACGAQVEHIWEVDLSEPVSELYTLTSDGCVPTLPQADYRYYPALREIPLESFVQAEVVIGGEGRIRDRYLLADDGARLSSTHFDTELDTPCSFWSIGDEPARCRPSGYDGGWTFTDDTCTTPVIETPEWCDVDERYVGMYHRDEDTLCWSYSLHELGPVVVPEQVYNAFAECAPETPIGTYAAVGPEITDLATAARGLGGDGRISSYYRQVGTIQVADYTLRDRELGVDCYLTESDDDTYCIPVGAEYADWLWADDRCTLGATVALVTANRCTGAWREARYAVRYEWENCTNRAHVYAVGAERPPGSLYTINAQNGCVPFPSDEWTRAYEVLAEVPITTFARFDRIVE